MLAAGWLVDSGIIKDGRAYYALVALAPAVFFGTVLASFRGLFQGHQLMTPPAISQILEQFIRVVTMVVLAYVLLPYGLEYAAAGAAFGAVPGSLMGMVVLGCFYRYYRKRWLAQAELAPCKEEISSIKLVKELLLLALPVSCANVLVPVTNSIDVLLVPGYLIASGFTVEQADLIWLPCWHGTATTAFGHYSHNELGYKSGACHCGGIYIKAACYYRSEGFHSYEAVLPYYSACRYWYGCFGRAYQPAVIWHS